ncbi:hypothetical protein SCCGRSA3_01043 [Marine Group I thaumarchaeote SCGC RSA3]|nr:hypothetical protein AAA799N04_01164 [Marine Group I thaumarchaeote SCGC AAA799-N04]KFM16657.1 hypothetical protein AAA799D11_00600 [Marine Group I thaumarchaeote SCGC AAA799-D11]KFM18710.1 hypothetical protein SCCGRSA3_01043 [Marine Group I thaumarchaeote SCGC RSA3]
MNIQESVTVFDKAKSAFGFAQELPPSPVYDVKHLENIVHLSTKTIKRKIDLLKELGLVDYNRGKFTIKREVISQPYIVLKTIFPSLIALKKARRFGKYYKSTDVNFMKKHLPKGSIITLDHKAHELTKYQTPLDLYVYVDDVEKVSKLLKNHGFREGKRGNVVLLPKVGSFENQIERVFLDCIANGGRSFLDAAAIMLTHKDMIKTRARFAGDTILKVQEDLPTETAY